MTCVVVASVPFDADAEALAQAAGRPTLTEARYRDSEGPRVWAWDFGDDCAEAEQAVARLNNIPSVSAKIREDSDEPRR